MTDIIARLLITVSVMSAIACAPMLSPAVATSLLAQAK
ncbi:hypothetical protein MPOCJGCO_4318 [Methylobacterium trifolii]|uniref:Uncharacterized protein n=1 Tax=Methylobacterium trifolii TaxID=1003092 RepID=A0ABQ4U3Y0_9HYPH|nr:hypothetical protein MPOCJGCO_4318 [Methylobacterium trifolii]